MVQVAETSALIFSELDIWMPQDHLANEQPSLTMQNLATFIRGLNEPLAQSTYTAAVGRLSGRKNPPESSSSSFLPELRSATAGSSLECGSTGTAIVEEPSVLFGLSCIKVAFCYFALMSQPVKLSDSLVLDARLTAEIAQRSIAGQIEFWAGLGRAVEGLLRGREVLALRKADAARPLSDCFETVDSSEGRQRVAEYLRTRPFPHYEAAAGQPGLLTRIDSDGTRTVGRFVNRRFEPIPESSDS